MQHQEDVFNYERAPSSIYIFEDTRDPSFSKSKSVLKNKLKGEVFSRNMKPNAAVIDGGRMLYSVVH